MPLTRPSLVHLSIALVAFMVSAVFAGGVHELCMDQSDMFGHTCVELGADCPSFTMSGTLIDVEASTCINITAASTATLYGTGSTTLGVHENGYVQVGGCGGSFPRAEIIAADRNYEEIRDAGTVRHEDIGSVTVVSYEDATHYYLGDRRGKGGSGVTSNVGGQIFFTPVPEFAIFHSFDPTDYAVSEIEVGIADTGDRFTTTSEEATQCFAVLHVPTAQTYIDEGGDLTFLDGIVGGGFRDAKFEAAGLVFPAEVIDIEVADGEGVHLIDGAFISFLRRVFFRVRFDGNTELLVEHLTSNGVVRDVKAVESAKRAFGAEFLVEIEAPCDGKLRLCFDTTCGYVNIVSCPRSLIL